MRPRKKEASPAVQSPCHNLLGGQGLAGAGAGVAAAPAVSMLNSMEARRPCCNDDQLLPAGDGLE